MKSTKPKPNEFSKITLKDIIFPYWKLSKEDKEWNRKVNDFLKSKPRLKGLSRDIMDLCRYQLEAK
jgi:hypothetical protein